MKINIFVAAKTMFFKQWFKLKVVFRARFNCTLAKDPRHLSSRDRPYFVLTEGRKAGTTPHLRGISQTAGSEQDV